MNGNRPSNPVGLILLSGCVGTAIGLIVAASTGTNMLTVLVGTIGAIALALFVRTAIRKAHHHDHTNRGE